MVAFYLPEESELPTTDLPQAIVPIASSVRVEAGATIPGGFTGEQVALVTGGKVGFATEYGWAPNSLWQAG